MDIKSILIATAVVAVVGLVIAILLSIAEKVFYVEVDEREILIRDCLAGNNCGACGYAGCDALAKAIVEGDAPVTACPSAGQSGADKMAEIMGVDAGEVIPTSAFVRCSGECETRKEKYNYFGPKTCASVKFGLGSGKLTCTFGCLGYGDCAHVCDNNAIRIVGDKAVVESEDCISCGKCVKACPQHLIKIVPLDAKYRVQCHSRLKGKAVKTNCSVGCIGCGICQRNCPTQAITLHHNIATIDYEKCIKCGVCAEKCPSKVIRIFE